MKQTSFTVSTRCGWIKFREHGKFLYGKIFCLKLKGAVYMRHKRLTILNGSEAWCLKENDI